MADGDVLLHSGDRLKILIRNLWGGYVISFQSAIWTRNGKFWTVYGSPVCSSVFNHVHVLNLTLTLLLFSGPQKFSTGH